MSSVARIEAPSGEVSRDHIWASERRRVAASVLSAATPRPSTSLMPSAGAGPAIEVGSSDEPIWIAVSGSAVAFSPTTRLIQPTRAEEPGSASSTSIIASKWLRLGAGRPTAWTAPNVPACHIGSSGAKDGCRPKLVSPPISAPSGTTMPGRAAVSRSWSAPRGTTIDSPSAPPRRLSTTTTLPPGAAPYATCRKASPNSWPAVSAPAPAAAVARKRRRLRVKSGHPQGWSVMVGSSPVQVDRGVEERGHDPRHRPVPTAPRCRSACARAASPGRWRCRG